MHDIRREICAALIEDNVVDVAKAADEKPWTRKVREWIQKSSSR